jgi:hypothetical protein
MQAYLRPSRHDGACPSGAKLQQSPIQDRHGIVEIHSIHGEPLIYVFPRRQQDSFSDIALTQGYVNVLLEGLTLQPRNAQCFFQHCLRRRHVTRLLVRIKPHCRQRRPARCKQPCAASQGPFTAPYPRFGLLEHWTSISSTYTIVSRRESAHILV